MSILKKYAQPTPAGEYGNVTGRVPIHIKIAFENYCHELNIPVSKAVALLIEAELKKIDQEENKPESWNGPYMTNISIPGDAIKPDPVPAPAARKPVTGTRGRLNAYARYDGSGKKLLPCPICSTWSNYQNFKRDHTDVHGFDSTIEFLSKYESDVLAMTAAYKDQEVKKAYNSLETAYE